MKKFLAVFIVLCVVAPAYAWPWSKDKKKKNGALNEGGVNSGYQGRLPDIKSEFDYMRPDVKSKDIFNVDENAKIQDLTPAPRQEKMYIDIIKKKDKTSNYIHDVNDIVLSLEKLKITIIQGLKTSLFNAQVSYFIDLAAYLQREYNDKPEANYISYKKIMELSNQAYSVATLRREATYYGKYLSQNDDGYIYSPNYVNEQTQYLLDAINQILPILKDAE